MYGQGDGYKTIPAPTRAISDVVEFMHKKDAVADAVHIVEVRAFCVVSAPTGEDAVSEFAVSPTDPSAGTTKRAWIIRNLTIADHSGSIDVSADAAVIHVLFGTDNVGDLEDGAMCVPYTAFYHGRLMLKARSPCAASGVAHLKRLPLVCRAAHDGDASVLLLVGRSDCGGEVLPRSREAFEVKSESGTSASGFKEMRWQVGIKSVMPALSACPKTNAVIEPCESNLRVFPTRSLPTLVQDDVDEHSLQARGAMGRGSWW